MQRDQSRTATVESGSIVPARRDEAGFRFLAGLKRPAYHQMPLCGIGRIQQQAESAAGSVSSTIAQGGEQGQPQICPPSAPELQAAERGYLSCKCRDRRALKTTRGNRT